MTKLTLPMPRLGETMDSGTIASWCVAEGARFERGETLLELETDKTLVQYPTLQSGRLIETLVAAGDVVDVGDPIAIIETDKAWPTVIDQGADARQSEPASSAKTKAVQPQPASIKPVASAETVSLVDGLRATPFARRLARLGGIDMQELDGTGRRGRIEATDVINALRGGKVHRPEFLFLHGLGSNALSWSGLIANLAVESDQVTALDLPGHGDNPQEAARIDALVDYVVTHLRSLSGKVCLVGHSLGAWVAATAASAVLDAVSALVLIAPAGCGPEVNADFVRGVAKIQDMAQLRALLALLGPRAAATPDAVASAMLGELRRGRLSGLVNDFLDGDLSRLDILPTLSHIQDKLPVSVVMGTQDNIFPKEHLFRLPSRISIHVVEAGHMPHWDAPATIAALLRKPI